MALNIRTEDYDVDMDRRPKFIITKEKRMRYDDEVNDEMTKISKLWKRNERRLAPLAFPSLVEEVRHKDGLHMSQISTPLSSAAVDMISSHGNARLSKLTGHSRVGGRSHASRGAMLTGETNRKLESS